MVISNKKVKLTKRVVDMAEPGATRYLIHDTGLGGFHAVIHPSGKKTFAVRYRVGGGRGGAIKQPAIGAYGSMTVDQARKIAAEWLAMARNGQDPAALRSEVRGAPRMAELFDRYMTEHAWVQKKPRSIEEDERNLNLYLRSAFGKQKVADVTRADVQRFHAGLSDKPTTANRALALLSKAFNLAEAWGIRPDGTNPCRHVKKYPEVARKRFLSRDELGRLGEALRKAEDGELGAVMPSAVAAIRLLVLTGMRHTEVLGTRWDWVDLDAGRINLPDSKSGEKVVVLSRAAVELLDSIPRQADNPFVITGGKPGAHLVNLKGPWGRIRDAAKLEDVRIHDLRHTFASVGAGHGQSLHVIGQLLGHSQASTTQRYAHLADDPQRAAADAIGDEVATMMRPQVEE